MMFREGQENVIKEILEAMKKNKVIFLDAPTGSGKSYINLALAKLRGSGYITTPLKSLVNQYRDSLLNNSSYKEFDATVLKGRNDYPCLYLQNGGIEDATADGAPCESPPKDWSCPMRDSCPYYIDRDIARAKSITATTLAYMFTGIRKGMDIMIRIPQTDPPQYEQLWKTRKVLIIDEAHNIDDQLVDFYTIEVGSKSYTRVITNTVRISFNYQALVNEPTLEKLSFLIKEEISEIDEYTDRFQGNDNILAKLAKLKTSLVRTLEKINFDVRYIYSKEGDKLKWKPYVVAPFTKKFFERFDNIVLSSATFVDPELLIQNLGLPNTYKIVKMKSTFPAKNSLVKLYPIAKISQKTLSNDLKLVVNGLNKIAKIHKNERGFIHCKTYEIQRYIFENSPPELKNRLWRHDSETRESALKEWIDANEKNSIFLSVHMGEGVDLVDDIARWQVIVKVPYLYRGDKYVMEHLAEQNGQRWYNQKAIIELIQMCGRVMRSKEDWGVTYILDSMALSLLFGNKTMLPDWFKERLKLERIL